MPEFPDDLEPAPEIADRQLRVGIMACEAGLFALDDVTLVRLFHVLARLVTVPHPEAVLAACLGQALGWQVPP